MFLQSNVRKENIWKFNFEQMYMILLQNQMSLFI